MTRSSKNLTWRKRDSTYHNDDQSLSVIVQVLSKLREAFKIYWIVSEILPLIHVINISMLNVLKEYTSPQLCAPEFPCSKDSVILSLLLARIHTDSVLGPEPVPGIWVLLFQ